MDWIDDFQIRQPHTNAFTMAREGDTEEGERGREGGRGFKNDGWGWEIAMGGMNAIGVRKLKGCSAECWNYENEKKER